MPAFGVIQEFQRASEEIKLDPSKANVWYPIISQYKPSFLSQCENAIKWSNEFVQSQLETVMFKGRKDRTQLAKTVVERLSDYQGNKRHERHLHAEECVDIGLDVEQVEKDPELQDILLTVHHCYMQSLANTTAYKMIENHLGTAFVKQGHHVAIPKS